MGARERLIRTNEPLNQRGKVGKKVPLTAQWQSTKIRQHETEYFGIGISASHTDPDAPHGYLYLSADFEQLQTDGAALGMRQLGALQPKAPKRMHQHISY